MSISNAVQPALYAKLPYDTLKSFDPIAMIVTSRFTLAVNPTVPANTVKEFVALAKAKPGDLQYASGGVGGALHLGMELFRIQAGIDLIHIPFRGAGPAAIDVIAGNTKALVATVSSVSSHIRSGKLRGLAVAAPKRNSAIPDVPTFIEAGMPQYEAGNWIGLAAPAGTPKPIIDKLAKEIAAIQDMPEAQQQMHNRGAELEKMGPAEFRAHIEKEIAKWGHVVREAKIPAQ
jgi:tripartite-type tricarboxylate transporter receptor subunit TctC